MLGWDLNIGGQLCVWDKTQGKEKEWSALGNDGERMIRKIRSSWVAWGILGGLLKLRESLNVIGVLNIGAWEER